MKMNSKAEAHVKRALLLLGHSPDEKGTEQLIVETYTGDSGVIWNDSRCFEESEVSYDDLGRQARRFPSFVQMLQIAQAKKKTFLLFA